MMSEADRNREKEILMLISDTSLSKEQKEAYRQEIFDLKYKSCIEYLENMKPFTDEYIPGVPIMRSADDYEKYVVSNYIRCGAIPKDKLEEGCTYYGNCRNASEAVWDGEKFTYIRHKFGFSYPEDINHFQDDDGYDVFVPIRKIEK